MLRSTVRSRDLAWQVCLLWLPLACSPASDASDSNPPGAPGESGVRFSEIMYNPVRENFADEPHEFVEIHNLGKSAVSLKGWRLSGDIQFAFGANDTIGPLGYAVIAKNKRKLVEVSAYRLSLNAVLGDFTGTLDNGKGEILLLDPAGKVAERVVYRDEFPWPIGADSLGAGEDHLPAALLPLDRHQYMGVSLERVTFTGSAMDPASWGPSPLDGATPGRANSVSGAQTIVKEIGANAKDRPAEAIRAADPVVVRALLSGAARKVELEYFVDDIERTDEVPERLPMTSGNDGYRATLPAKPDRSIVRYRILADLGKGLAPLSPRPSDPNPWHAYFVNPVIEGQTPVYELFISTANWSRLWTYMEDGKVPGNIGGSNPDQCAMNPTWDARLPAVMVSEGKVYDVQARYQGSRFNRRNGLNINLTKWPESVKRPAGPLPFRAMSWSIEFPRYRTFHGRHQVTLNKLTQSCQGFITRAGNELFESLGMPFPKSSWVRYYVNGAYYHYMLDVEHMDEDLLKRYFGKGHQITDLFKANGYLGDEGPVGIGDGSLLKASCGYSVAERYAATYNRVTLKDWKGDSAEEVREMLEQLHKARAGGIPAMRKFLADTFDLPLLKNYMALMNWMGPYDDYWQNHFMYLRGDKKWVIWAWDLDNLFGGFAPADTSFFSGAEGDRANRSLWWNYLKDTYLRAYRAEHIDTLRDLAKHELSPDAIATLVDQVSADYKADEAALAPGGISTSTACDAKPEDQLVRMKTFARTRYFRVMADLFD